MPRRTLIWHIGSADAPRPVVPANLDAHRDALHQFGVRVAASAPSARLATHELLRTHRAAGLSRAQVEGLWSRVCDRVWEHKGTSVLSTPDLCVAADEDQLRLALDPLIGVEVHLVITLDTFSQQLYGGWLAELRSGRSTGWDTYASRVLDPERGHRQSQRFWTGHDVAAVADRWGWTLHAERIHVLAMPDPTDQWHALLGLLDVPQAGLDPVLPAYADPAGVAVLRRVNRQVESPLSAASMDLLGAGDREAAAMPTVGTTGLTPLLERWAQDLRAAGHDVRGDLTQLTEDASQVSLPGPRDQLGVAVEALADALAENSRLQEVLRELERDRDRSDRKRRRLKRRLKRLAPGAGPSAAPETGAHVPVSPDGELALNR